MKNGDRDFLTKVKKDDRIAGCLISSVASIHLDTAIMTWVIAAAHTDSSGHISGSCRKF